MIDWVAQPLARPNWCRTVMFGCQARPYRQDRAVPDSLRRVKQDGNMEFGLCPQARLRGCSLRHTWA